MRNLWLIARREYGVNIRRRSFLFAAFGVPVFIFVMWYLIFAFTGDFADATGTLGNIGYVDQAGFLAEPVEEPGEYIAFADEEAARQALLDGEIGAYFVIAPDFVSADGRVDAYSYEAITDGLEDQLEDFLAANVAQLVSDEALVERLLDPMEMTVIDAQTGEELDQDAFLGKILGPFIFGVIYLMAVNTTSQFLMSSVVEEKETRMMEILATSSTPLEMLWGKVLGLGLLGLTQVAVWAVIGVVALTSQAEIPFLEGLTFTPDYLVVVFLYFILGYFLFGALMAGIGAAVTAEQEGRQFASIFTLIAVIPMMAAVVFFENPNGTLPVILSLFPLTAPLSMLVRIPIAPVPGWQVIASLVLMALSMVGTVWLGSRVFRLGMLMYGKRLTLREIAQAVRQGRRTAITTAAEGEGS